MNTVKSHRVRTLLYLISFTGLFWGSSLFPASAQSARTEIRRINRNFPENVQRYIRNWEIARPDQVLANGNWLATGPNSMAWMWYSSFGVIYRQYAETVSQFVPGTRCGFRVTSGSNIFLDRGRVPGCSQIAGNVRISTYSAVATSTTNALVASAKQSTADDATKDEAPDSVASGYLVYRSPSQSRTIIGALAHPAGHPIEVESLTQEFRESGEETAGDRISLNAGEYAIVLDNGRLTRGMFSLENFYENSTLALGLGNSPEDREYVEQLESPEEQALFEDLRAATVAALLAQPRAGAFELQDFNSRDLSPSSPTSPVCTAVDFADVNEDGELELFSCFD